MFLKRKKKFEEENVFIKRKSRLIGVIYIVYLLKSF